MGNECLLGTGVRCCPGRAVASCFQAHAGPSLPLISILLLSPSGEQCGGCRRSNTTDRPHSFQVILTDRPSLELSAENEEDMADWMQYFCQAVSKGVSWGQAPSVGASAPSLAQSPFGTAEGSRNVWQDGAGSFILNQEGFPTGEHMHPEKMGLHHTRFYHLFPPHTGDPPGCFPNTLRSLLPGADGREGFHVPRGLSDQLLPLAGHCGADRCHGRLHGGRQGVLYPGECRALGPAGPGLGECPVLTPGLFIGV